MSQSNKGAFSVFKQDVGSISRHTPSYCRWTEAEDKLLLEAVDLYGAHKWSLIASHVPERTPVQCSTRWLGALNPHVHKGRWSKEEDDVLTASVHPYLNIESLNQDNLSWSRIAQRIPHRTGIQCQARWTEALDPSVRKGRWKKEEDEKLEIGVRKFGCCWIRVAESIPGRTQRQSRTRWNQIQSKSKKEVKSFTKKKKQRKCKDNDVAQWKSSSQKQAINTLSAMPIRLAVPDQTPYILLSQNTSNSITIPFDILSPLASPTSTLSSYKEDDDYFCTSPASSCSGDTLNSIQLDNASPLTAIDATRILDELDSSHSLFINEKPISGNDTILLSPLFSNGLLNELDLDPSVLLGTPCVNQGSTPSENFLLLDSELFLNRSPT